jgi:hypothetical protein
MNETAAGTIPGCHAAEIRRLVHDLSNALEIIVQTSYLLKSANLTESEQQWLTLMEGGVREATRRAGSFLKQRKAPPAGGAFSATLALIPVARLP